jgi:mannose-1-phosphate guanylyltransferase/mannose-6-phosphate isomerase
VNAEHLPIVPVVLSGGSGTRLWPVSRSTRPKQLTALHGRRTMIQATVQRVDGVPGLRPPLVVCNEAHAAPIALQMADIGVRGTSFLLEPEGRDTAPAVAAAALVAAADGEDPVLLVLPADHVISDVGAFRAAALTAADLAGEGHLVTFGIVPDRPETGYGYIRRGATVGETSAGPVCLVDGFREKPDEETAARYVASGDYLWNSGMFAFTASRYLEELDRYQPELVARCRAAVAAADREDDRILLGDQFVAAPAISIDYAVMEHTDHAVVIPLDAGWNDLGSWAAMWDIVAADEVGNVVVGDVVVEGTTSSYVRACGRLVAVVGLQDVIVVDTPDALLVCSREAAQDVKGVVERLRAEGRAEADEFTGE